MMKRAVAMLTNNNDNINNNNRGKPLAWDVTVPGTYAEAHVANLARQAGAAANLPANNKVTKYDQLSRTHVFYPVAIYYLAPPGDRTGRGDWKTHQQKPKMNIARCP